jgi:hypothetical protein
MAMQTYGRLIAKHQDEEALDMAAEYLAIAEERERSRLLIWLEEGTRNNADSHDESQRIIALVISESEKI